MSPSLSSRIAYLSVLILLGWALAIFYALLSQALSPGWFSIALLHSGAALLLWRFVPQLRLARVWGWGAYGPALGIALGSLGAAWLSRTWIGGAPPLNPSWDPRLLAFVIWIPLVEELVFRYGIGGWARQKLGNFWGVYASALVFAMAHGAGAWDQLAIPLGPLLLGFCCEWLYVVSGRLSAAIALHAACNASGWIFATVDERWLDWLQALYLKV
jgi:membrane protease YdiL (CAAX protease family)